MLALTRKTGEAIIISKDVEITVLEVRGDQVKLGIKAPREVPIYRKEVYLQIKEENQAALDAKNLEKLKKIL
jgi:carbon storage regulator